jgi:hypothetical protein
VRLCPRLHVNPRIAKTCSQCGSSDLSKPQPKVSLAWRVLGFLVRVLLGALLVCASLWVAVAVIEELLKRPEVQAGMVALGLLLVGLWFLWAMLPDWIRKIIRRLLEKKERRNER